MQKLQRHTKKIFIGIVGGVVVLVGVVAIPYPGPGWLIVFMGLAILATEFAWAQYLLDRLRREYDYWVQWLKCQHITVRLIVLTLTGCIVVVTIWLCNGYGLLNDWLQLHWDWLRSPFLQ